MVPSECAPVGFWPRAAISGCHVETQLAVQMKRPFVSALSEYRVRPARLTSTVLPPACPVLTVLVVVPDALDIEATATIASAAITAVTPRMEFRFKFMPPAFHGAGPLLQRTLVVRQLKGVETEALAQRVGDLRSCAVHLLRRRRVEDVRPIRECRAAELVQRPRDRVLLPAEIRLDQRRQRQRPAPEPPRLLERQ